MRIGQKLVLGFFLLALLVGAVGLFGLNASKTISQSYGEISEEFQEEVYAATEAQSYATRSEGHLFLYLTLGDEIDKEKFFQRHQSLMEQYEILKKAVTTSGGIHQVNQIKTDSDNIFKYGKELIEAYDENPATFGFKKHEPLMNLLHDTVDSLRKNGEGIAKRRAIDAALETSGYAKRTESHLFLYLTLGNEIDKEIFFLRYQSLMEQYEILEKAVSSPEGLQQLSLLKVSMGDIFKYGKELIEAYDENPATFDFKKHETLVKQFHDASSSAREQGVLITKSETNLITGNIEALKMLSTALQKKILSLMIFSTILALVLGFYFAHSIAKPLKKLAAALSKVRKGEYEIIAETGSKDEVGILTRSFNDMSKDLARYHSQLDELVQERTSELIAANNKYLEEIDERKKLQGQLVQAQKMEAIGHLAGGIAHDFNNILTAIIGYSELALRRLPDDSPVKDTIKSVTDAGKKAASLTNQLLAFSRKQVLDMKIVNLNELCGNLAKMLIRLIGENIVFEIHAKNVRNIWADPIQIEQVLMNLAVNARDAMPGGGQFIIETSEEEIGPYQKDKLQGIDPGTYIKLVVKDTGTGITPEVVEKIFDPFYTTKGLHKGTGLGMSIVHGIIKQHGGNIFVNSEVGKGTEFTMYLPVHKGKSSSESKSSTIEDLKGGNETILVLEDDYSVRKLIIEILQPLGYNLLEAETGEQALHICHNHQGNIDLLLADIVLPGMNGREVAEQILAWLPEIKTIYLSGYTDDIISHHGVLDPGCTLINKPLNTVKLTESIRDTLGKS